MNDLFATVALTYGRACPRCGPAALLVLSEFRSGPRVGIPTFRCPACNYTDKNTDGALETLRLRAAGHPDLFQLFGDATPPPPQKENVDAAGTLTE